MHSGIFDPRSILSLGDLADPAQYNDALSLSHFQKEFLLAALQMMLVIRLSEEAIANLIIQGEAKCPCHLGIGQEAVAVGVSSNLSSNDKIFGGHRSHSHYLAQGGSTLELFAEILGKESGCSRGMGGSMHLQAQQVGFVASVPIVGATIPIAVGAALALQKDKEKNLAVSYFGDGASEEGVFHESLNFAANYKLPVLFVCENNLHSSHLDIKLRQPSDLIARFAISHTINAFVVDGNDVCAVAEASKELIEKSRRGEGPGFLEAVTYRWRGHVGPNEDMDVGVRRTPGDLDKWKGRDPIKRLKEALLQNNIISESEYTLVLTQVKENIESDIQKAKDAPYPSRSSLLNTVYYQN